MFLHRYVDPEAIRMRGCEKSLKKAYFDNYMVKCFGVENEELIFL